MPFLRFVLNSLDRTLTSPGGIGGQCVDLANEYLRQCYGQAHVYLNAADWAKLVIPGWTWVFNRPTNFPLPGSIVVWAANGGHGIGQYGHVALAIDADAMDLLTFDQNWLPGSPCRFVMHDYIGVAGWHTPPPQ